MIEPIPKYIPTESHHLFWFLTLCCYPGNFFRFSLSPLILSLGFTMGTSLAHLGDILYFFCFYCFLFRSVPPEFLRSFLFPEPLPNYLMPQLCSNHCKWTSALLLVLFHLLFLIVPNMFKLGWSYKRKHLAGNLPGLVKVEVNIYQILSFSFPGLSRPFIPTTEIRNLTTQPHPPTALLGEGAQCIRIGLMKDNFVFDHILHFSDYTRVRLG